MLDALFARGCWRSAVAARSTHRFFIAQAPRLPINTLDTMRAGPIPPCRTRNPMRRLLANSTPRLIATPQRRVAAAMPGKRPCRLIATPQRRIAAAMPGKRPCRLIATPPVTLTLDAKMQVTRRRARRRSSTTTVRTSPHCRRLR
jgi:hypothetical protein